LFLTDWLSGLSEEEKLELYHGVGYDENANETKMPKEVIYLFVFCTTMLT